MFSTLIVQVYVPTTVLDAPMCLSYLRRLTILNCALSGGGSRGEVGQEFMVLGRLQSRPFNHQNREYTACIFCYVSVFILDTYFAI